MRRSKQERRSSGKDSKFDNDQTDVNDIPEVVHEVPEGLEQTATKNDRKEN